MIADDPVNVVLAHVGQGHIVSLEERKAGIVVLKIERFPHARRHLVNKTKNTFIMTGAVIIHEAVLKFHSEIILKLLLDLQLPLFPVGFLNQYGQVFFIDQVMIIEDILDLLIVDGQQKIPGFNPQFLRDAARFYRTHLMAVVFFLHVVFSFALIIILNHAVKCNDYPHEIYIFLDSPWLQC